MRNVIKKKKLGERLADWVREARLEYKAGKRFDKNGFPIVCASKRINFEKSFISVG